MGSLVAIEAAAAHPDRVAGIVLTGASSTMRVHPDLQAAADQGDHLAIDLISGWSHTADRFGGHAQPGTWSKGVTERLLERSLGVSLSVSLAACAAFDAGARAGDVGVPATVVVGLRDSMTSPSSAHALIDAISDVAVVELPEAGHNLVFDSPAPLRRAVLDMVERTA
jgi:pimeloyl-ACP methyl ester carboxylesterase